MSCETVRGSVMVLLWISWELQVLFESWKMYSRGSRWIAEIFGSFLMFSLCFLIHDLSSCLMACLDASYCVTPGWYERWNVIFVAALPWILWEALFPDTHAKLPNFLFNFCILLHSPIWIWLCQRCVCSSLPGGATAIWSTVWTITQFSHR